jgi:membrane-associated phospholipid phosphatase
MQSAETAGTLVEATPRRRAGAGLPDIVVRLVIAAAILWGVLSGIGYLLTHQLTGTAFEEWDAAGNRWLAGHRTSTWNAVTHWLTYGGETMTVVAVGLVFFIGLRLALGRWRESTFLAAALAGEVTIFLATALMIHRNRPPVSHLDAAPPTSSFPSGHTAAAVVVYGALAVVAVRVCKRAWLRRLAVSVAVVLPVCVAFARLYRGMHFLTDVLGGALLAVVWLAVAWAVVLRGRCDDRPPSGVRRRIEARR